MKRRIFFCILIITAISLFVTASILCVIFYNQFSQSVQSEIRERAKMLRYVINENEYEKLTIPDMRLTIVGTEGIVLYDDDEDVNSLPNHSDREEIIEALNGSEGESKRFSDTLGQETYYYAVKLDNGSVLRVAKTINSIFGIFIKTIPAIILVLLIIIILGYITAGSLTKRIIKPLNEVELNGKINIPYDELTPFIKTIYEQRAEIELQMEDLKKRGDTMTTIMENMSEGVIILNQKGFVISANKNIKSFYDIEEDVSGKNILELFRDTEFSSMISGSLGGKRGEMNISRENKTYRAYFSPVAGIGIVILFMDITEKINAETIRKEFSANVSHELKTPLTTIYGNAELLLGGIVKEEDREKFYTKIKDESERLIKLIEDIILISRLDENSDNDFNEIVDISQIAAETVSSLEAKAIKNNISLNLKSEKILYKSNRSQIYELFYNLIDNAIKYNKPNGKVDINVLYASDNSLSDKQIKITITDTGIGIPKESQNRVFERFYRVDKSRSKITGGTGLGLAIVKHIVLYNKGKINLKSAVNEGTTITVTLPSEN